MSKYKSIFLLIIAVLFAIGVLIFTLPYPKQHTAAVVSSETEVVNDTISDAAGNRYPVVTIGEQKWMAVNLKNTTFDCGDSIQVIFTNGAERGPGVKLYDNKPRYAYYNNQADLGFGVIYSYSAITKCNICPPGYRIPTKSDWEKLLYSLGGSGQAGKRLFKGGDSGFHAALGGRIDSYGSVLSGRVGFWFSLDFVPDSNQNLVYIFELSYQGVTKLVGQEVKTGNYVRCLQ